MYICRRNLVEVSSIPFNDRKVMSLTFSLPFMLIAGIGLHLEFDNEATLCILGMLVVHGRGCFPKIT
jgi:hypothetical protein